MALDLLGATVEVEVQAGVVEGAVLDLPVMTRIAQDAVVESREGLGAGGGESVERAVAAAPLQQAEQCAARRYERLEHGESLTSSCRRNRDCAVPCAGVTSPRPRSNMIGRPPSSAWCSSSSASRRWPDSDPRRHDDPAISPTRPHLRRTGRYAVRAAAQRAPKSSSRSSLPNMRAVSTAEGVPAAGSAPAASSASITSRSPLKTAPANG